MTQYDAEAKYRDALEYEKLAAGHDDRAALNESLAHAKGLPQTERELHGEIATMHGTIAAKYRALAACIQKAAD